MGEHTNAKDKQSVAFPRQRKSHAHDKGLVQETKLCPAYVSALFTNISFTGRAILASVIPQAVRRFIPGPIPRVSRGPMAFAARRC